MKILLRSGPARAGAAIRHFSAVAVAAFAIAIPFAAVGLLAALRLTRTPATAASVQPAAASPG
jgi:hypothetical protein